MNTDWRLFKGEGPPRPHVAFPEAPPWRTFDRSTPFLEWQPKLTSQDIYWQRAINYRVPPEIIDPINAALWLRRPLLVTGAPGAGKTTLIYRVAYELALGPVFEWHVNSRSRVKDALYEYDALARLQDEQRKRIQADQPGRYITLRALGTALLPASRPRALLIDEIDKADPDLPNDLLNLFEEGSFEIPELIREDAVHARVRPMTPVSSRSYASLPADSSKDEVEIAYGSIRCHEFPFVVLTSNGEREFPAAFLRRCIRVKLPRVDTEHLKRVVSAHLGLDLAENVMDKISGFAQDGTGMRATDQLLNALFLVHGARDMDEATRKTMHDLLTQPLQ